MNVINDRIRDCNEEETAFNFRQVFRCTPFALGDEKCHNLMALNSLLSAKYGMIFFI